MGVLALIATAFLAFGAPPAFGVFAHTITTGEFGKEGPKASGLGGGCRLAYQSASHHLYLFSGGKIWGLDRTAPGTVSPLGGGFPITTGINTGCGDPDMTVDNSGVTQNLYAVPSNNSIYGWSSSGAALGAPFPLDAAGETCGVATTSSGEIWGGTYSGGKVTKFSSAGTSLGAITPGIGANCKIEIDRTTNDLYVISYGGGIIRKLAASDGYTPGLTFNTPGSGGNATPAINGAKKRIYVPVGSAIKAYDTTTGALVETIEIPGAFISALAIDEPTDTLFAADQSGDFIREIPDVNVPKVTTGEPTGNTSVSGTVEPDGGGNVTECYFAFRKASEGTYPPANKQPCLPATLPYTTNQAVTATLPGLLGETEYKYKLVAANATPGGVNSGAEKSITPHNVKGLFTEEAANVTRTGAELKASFEGNGEPTKYYFEWGTTTEYGTQSSAPPGEPIGSPTYPPKTFLTHPLSGLTPDTTYHFRVVAENGLGVSPGQDRTFTTLPAVQSLVTAPATNVGRRTATLNASFVGDGTHTTYHFEYGKTTSYGTPGPIEDQGSPSGATPIHTDLTGLDLQATYHYRISATNPLGTTVRGPDQEFTTLPAVAKLATVPVQESDITQEGVTLHGEFEGNGEDTHYFFEYGLTTKYGKKTAEPPGDDAGSPTGIKQLSSTTTEFDAYTTYHYRVVASNGIGTSVGKDMTFTTNPAPLPDISNTSASVIGPTTAMFEAEVNPNRWPTVYRFEYGPTTAYGNATEIGAPITSDPTMHPISDTVDNLAPATLYHFRAVAINFTGTTYGPDQVLITPAVPTIDSTSASSITQSTARLDASVNPNSSPTTVRFEYGSTPAYGQSTAGQAIGQDTSAHGVGTEIAGLSAGAIYHFRAVATNGYGTSTGPDQTFTTAPATAAVSEAGRKPPVRCRKGFVKRHGKCVRKPRHRRHHRHSTHRNG